ncbi:MAG: peptide chain release factor 1 [Leptolyngbyaceae cyanobacterium SU_3_3]|nr:peptide chain release factor 1 [Leptolyngbyaceae cyanobacterium SU_3_3]
MFNPLRRLRFLPWVELLQVALVTVAIASLLDFLLARIFVLLPVALSVIMKLLDSPIGLLVYFAVTIGIGALGVAILERWFRFVSITNSTLWALVPCLALWILLRLFCPFLLCF